MSEAQQERIELSMPLQRNISMTKFDEDILLRYQQELGIRSFSGTWVVQLRDWARMTGRLPELAAVPS